MDRAASHNPSLARRGPAIPGLDTTPAEQPSAKVIGGGLAGLSAAVALASLGWRVDLHEAKPFLGGRATSYPVRPDEPDSERIDNCQHVLLRCCDNLMDFYRRCGVAQKIRFDSRLHFVRPGGRVDVLERGRLPQPFHFAESFLKLGFLGLRDKLSLIRTLRAMESERLRPDLDHVSMGVWLRSHHVTADAFNRFWRPILVSALNEEPERASAKAAFQVFTQGLMGSRTSYEMGVPAVPLAELYDGAGKQVNVHLRSCVDEIDPESGEADLYICAVPYDRVNQLMPRLELDVDAFSTSPITGVHLWFDRPVTALPHAVLLDRTMQWMFRKGETYIQCVVSASRELLPTPRGEIIALAVRELTEYFPAVAQAKLVRSHVVKEARATYSITPGLEEHRPAAKTRYPNLFLAGDWTATGWPATMEGAVRSGYQAAEAAASSMGRTASFLK